MWNLFCLGIFALTAVFSYLLVFPCRKLARLLDIVDYPSPRKVHREPTPLLGGLAIYLSFCLAVAASLLLVKIDLLPCFIKPYVPGIQKVTGKISAVLTGGLLVVGSGLVDDVMGLKPGQKLSLQILTSAVIFASGIRISMLVENFFWSAAVTISWLVFMMNSFNLLDNMDGLSSGVALVAGSIFLLAAISQGQVFVSTILAVFLGSVAGFLVHNFPPAKIFMGESGSSFLGYFLGISAVLLTFYHYNESQTFLPFFTPVVVFAVPFFDTLSVIWIRWKRHQSIFQADKNHLSHRLVNLGLSQKQAVLVIYGLTFSTGLGALLLPHLDLLGGILILVQTAAILGIVSVLETTGRKNNVSADRQS